MKNIVTSAKGLILFDLPLQTTAISNRFGYIQSTLNIQSPGWSLNGTQQKLIYYYWFNYVVWHFAIVFGIPALILFLINIFSNPAVQLVGIFSAGILSFAILYLFHYRPMFSSEFLPRLETIKEAFESKQLEQVDKCRKAQLSNFALTLIFYALDKSAKLNALQCNDRFAQLLGKLYGVDAGSLKKNMALIVGTGKTLAGRKATESQNQFEEAYAFLEEINCTQGIAALKKVESKLLHQSQHITS